MLKESMPRRERQTDTQPFNGPLSRATRVGQYQKKHSLTHTHPVHQTYLSTSSIYCNAQHPPRSIYVLDSPFQQPFPRSSLVYLLVWNLQLHAPYISSPNHYLLFTTLCPYHCNFFAVVPRICHGQREMKQNTSTSLHPAVVSSNTVSGISYKWTLPQRSPQTSNSCHGDGCCHGDNCCGDGCCGDDTHHVMAVTQRCFDVGNSRRQQTCSL